MTDDASPDRSGDAFSFVGAADSVYVSRMAIIGDVVLIGLASVANVAAGCGYVSVRTSSFSPTTMPGATSHPTEESALQFDGLPQLVVCSLGGRLVPATLPSSDAALPPHVSLVVEAFRVAGDRSYVPVVEGRFTSLPMLVGTDVDVRPVKEPRHYVVDLLVSGKSAVRLSEANARKLVDWMRSTTPKGGTVSIGSPGQSLTVNGSDLIDQLDAALALIDLDDRG